MSLPVSIPRAEPEIENAGPEEVPYQERFFSQSLNTKIRWVRNYDMINYRRPKVWFTIGRRGAGKSAQVEATGEEYLDQGAALFDVFSSRDGENLAWLRAPSVQDKHVLLLTAENVSVKGAPCDVKEITKLSIADFDYYDLVISSSPFYRGMNEEFILMSGILERLYVRRRHWTKVIHCLCREASNLIYSRLKFTEEQKDAKVEIIYMLRESRHSGIGWGLDALRPEAIDIDIRTLADYTIFKALGIHGLPDDFRFMYKYLRPAWFQNMKPSQLAILTAEHSAIGLGTNSCPIWHKQENEDITKVLDLEVDFGSPPERVTGRGGISSGVGVEEHSKMVDLYLGTATAPKRGMSEIGIKFSRSSHTVFGQLKKHDRNVQSLGSCPQCAAAGGSNIMTPINVDMRYGQDRARPREKV